MFGTILERVAGYLGSRFILTAYLPTVAFCLGVLSLVATDIGWSTASRWWVGGDWLLHASLIVAAVVGTLILAALLATRTPFLIRLYEGYWGCGAVGRRLIRLGRSMQKLRAVRLRKVIHSPKISQSLTDAEALAAQGAAFMRRYYEVPADHLDNLKDQDFQPTRLGNIILAAERYPWQRYGVDAVFFWPRLYQLLPENLRISMSDARSNLEMMVNLSALFILFGVIALIYGLSPSGLPLIISLLIATSGLLLAFATYLGAIQAAIGYGDVLRTTFDLHRRSLLTAMGYVPPTTLEAERELWKAIAQWLYRRTTEHPELLRFTPLEAHGVKAEEEGGSTPVFDGP
jgi:hypothetical protein